MREAWEVREVGIFYWRTRTALKKFCSVKEIEHDKEAILRGNLRNILSDVQHSLHVHHIRADRVEILVPWLQAQAVVDSLIKVGHSVISNYSIEDMQVLFDGSSEEQRQRRNTYCSRRALQHALSRRNMGIAVKLPFEKKEAAIEK